MVATPHGATGFAKVLEWIGLVGALLFSTLALLFTAGYALEDPGGLSGIGLVLAMVVPMLALAALVLWAPQVGAWVLIALVVVAVGVAIWQISDPRTLRDFEFENGPISAIGGFLPLPALGLLGARRGRPLLAGGLLLAIAVSSIVAETWNVPFHMGSSSAVALPMLLAGLLFGAAGLITRLR